MGVKRIIRRGAAHLVGGLRLAKPLAWLSDGGAAILAYHRVLDPGLDDLDAVEPGMHVTKKTFEAHIDFLRSSFRICALNDLVRRLLTGEAIPTGSVALTFDDGWLDTYEVAFPILYRRGVPATVFVPTALVGTHERFWFSRAAEAATEIWRRRDLLRRAFPDEALPREAEFIPRLLALERRRESFIAKVIEQTKELPLAVQGATLVFLTQLAGREPKNRREMVSWDELREMARDTFEIGSHTAHHVILTGLEPAEVKRELDDSRLTIGREIGRAPISFCYPNGNYDVSIQLQVQRSGYACALTTTAGLVGSHPALHALPRLGVHQGVAPDAHGLALLLSGVG